MPSNLQIVPNQGDANHFEASMHINITCGRCKDVSEFKKNPASSAEMLHRDQ